jgi:uncharacterized protein (TIGR03663 family)
LKERRRAALVFLAIAAIAAGFRFPQLAARPMHADEGVNGDKVGVLLEQGRYEYSTVDFHGPTLYYAALAMARLHGVTDYHELNEAVLRSVPAMTGVLLVAAHFCLIPYLGFAAAAWAALFTAVSPAMVYYSRYFIHENLLVLFTFGAILAVLAYLRRPAVVWAVVAGAMFGLMFATKETWIIAAGCMAVAGVDKLKHVLPKHLALALIGFTAMAVVMLSSFGTHPRGVVDSVLAYGTYFARGVGVDTVHVHPWYFYFSCLRGETLIAVLAVAGLVSSNVPRFLKIYTVLMVVVYCALPYKVPWNVLSFWHATILLGGAGMVWLGRRVPKVVTVALVAIAAAQLGSQAYAYSFRQASDPRNPWVYAHTGTDVFAMMKQIEALAAVAPGGRAMPIQIFTRENLWPLPWYLRRYSNVRWWNGVSDTAPLAPVLLATPDMEPTLLHRIYEVPPPGQREMYVNMFDRYMELRPRIEVRGYVAKSLWDELP